MTNVLVKTGVRAWFACSRRAAAEARIGRARDRYLALAARVDAETGARSVRVPPLPGVDPDMRAWSFFQILAHNALVNRSITAIVTALARGEEPRGAALIDPQRDVMPPPDAGPEQIAAFAATVADHLAQVAPLDRLRGTRRRTHPVFGDFDAHSWHCMFGFHLGLHLRQASRVVEGAAGSARA